MFSIPLIQPTKRRREDDDLGFFGDEDGIKHHDKRPRALPFRTSPTAIHSPSSFSQNHSFAFRPQTLTPVDSSEDGSDDEMSATFSRRSQEPQSRSSSSQPFTVSTSLDDDDDKMDMTESQPSSSTFLPPPPPISTRQSKESSSAMPSLLPMSDGFESTGDTAPKRSSLPPKITSPSSFLSIPTRTEINPDGGRIPTPVYGHFSQIGGATNMLRMPSHATPRDLAITPIPASPMSPIQPTSEAAWWHRRRLPSPAEDGDQEDTPMSPVGMIDDMLPRLNVSPAERIAGIDSVDGQSDSTGLTLAAPDISSVRRSPSPFGRARSNATSSATNPPSISTSRLSMGYRADCEKCVRRVPGHYTHILR